MRSESQDTSSLLAEPAVDEKKSKSFTNDDLEAKWKAYIALHDEDPGTKAFLEKHYPELTDENTIKVLVDNKFQEKELMQMNLMTFLRKELNNDSIKLHIELAPENDFKKHQSPQEIYKRMAKDYPNLERLRKNLDMEID